MRSLVFWLLSQVSIAFKRMLEKQQHIRNLLRLKINAVSSQRSIFTDMLNSKALEEL